MNHTERTSHIIRMSVLVILISVSASNFYAIQKDIFIDCHNVTYISDRIFQIRYTSNLQKNVFDVIFIFSKISRNTGGEI